jgi:hypothetical protein
VITAVDSAPDYYESPYPFASDSGTFETVNCMVCELDVQGSTVSEFQDIHRIPIQWAKYVEPAVVDARKFAATNNGSTNSKSVDIAAARAGSPNPFIAIGALERLISEKKLARSTLGTLILARDYNRTAVVAYVLAKSGWLDDRSNGNWLTEQVVKHNSFDFSAGVVLGLSVASQENYYVRSGDSSENNASKELLSMANRSAQSFSNLTNYEERVKGAMEDMFDSPFVYRGCHDSECFMKSRFFAPNHCQKIECGGLCVDLRGTHRGLWPASVLRRFRQINAKKSSGKRCRCCTPDFGALVGTNIRCAVFVED